MSKINKVFGIGLGRTGTLSLARAMHWLGYTSKHSPKDFGMIAEFEFLNDISISWRFEFLDCVFHDSKFILTTRDIDTWMESNRARSNKKRELGGLGRLQNRYMMYGVTKFDEDKFRIAYYEYHARVYKYFEYRKKDLLVMNIKTGDGWEKLCSFLGKEIPDTPFPHLHKTNFSK